jgi:hypothetical protein
MPQINNIFEFTAEEQQLISDVMTSDDFCTDDWSSDELVGLRSRIRAFYREEQSGLCAFCQKEVSLSAAANCQVEHIAPKSKSIEFMFEPRNLCVICADCNIIKRAKETLDDEEHTIENPEGRVRYPSASSSFKIVHPHIDVYSEHIYIAHKIYADRSAKGHFTIGCCKLNRFLYQFGVNDNFIDDSELNSLMNRFLISQSSIEKTQILTRLRDSLNAF